MGFETARIAVGVPFGSLGCYRCFACFGSQSVTDTIEERRDRFMEVGMTKIGNRT